MGGGCRYIGLAKQVVHQLAGKCQSNGYKTLPFIITRYLLICSLDRIADTVPIFTCILDLPEEQINHFLARSRIVSP